jgi:hypothetical protein
MIKNILLFVLVVFNLLLFSPSCPAEEIEMYPEARVKENDYIKVLNYSLQNLAPDSAAAEAKINAKVLEVELLFKDYCQASKKQSKLNEVVNNPKSSTDDIAKTFAEEIINMGDYTVPSYKCNPGMKVFLTTYGKGQNEIMTQGHYISTSPQKLEIFPGEIIKTKFYIIEDSEINLENPVFQIWVPK